MAPRLAPFGDIRVAYALAAVVTSVLCLGMLLARRELREFPGLGRFGASYGLFVVSMALLAGGAALPDFWAIAVSNVGLVVGSAVLLEGAREFNGLPPSRAATFAASGLAAVLFPVFLYVWPSAGARVALSSLLLAALLGAAAWTTWRYGRRVRSAGSLPLWAGASLGVSSAMLAGRAVLGVGVGGTFDGVTASALGVGLVSGVCWTVAVVLIASRRLRGELRSQKDLFAKLLAVARAGGEGPALDGVLADVLEALQGMTAATGAAILLVDEAGEFKSGIFGRGDLSPTAIEAAAGRRALEEGLVGWVARNRQTTVLGDLERDPRWRPLPFDGPGARSALVAPIATGSILVGVLALFHSDRGWFGMDLSRVVDAAAAQVALVLRNAQIGDERSRAARRHALLNDVLVAAARRGEPEEIARAAANAISGGTRWQNVLVAIPGEDQSLHLFGEAEEDARSRAGEGILRRVFATGRTEVLAGRGSGGESAPAGRSVLAVPLSHDGRVLGALHAESGEESAFSREDVGTAEALAEAIALGLERARLSRVREDLTRALVHDLRSPLVSIRGSLRLLDRAKSLSVDDRKLVEIAERNSAKLVGLVEGILEVSRLENSDVPISRSRVDLGDLAGEAMRLASPRALARDVVLEGGQALGKTVLVDRGLIFRVMSNLLDNAIKFSETAGRVSVEVRREGDRVLLSVQDHGPGVDAQARARLFETFAFGQHRASGSGLGLAFCRLAVEANGGRIWLEDTPGGGATFVVGLPSAPGDGELGEGPG